MALLLITPNSAKVKVSFNPLTLKINFSCSASKSCFLFLYFCIIVETLSFKLYWIVIGGLGGPFFILGLKETEILLLLLKSWACYLYYFAVAVVD